MIDLDVFQQYGGRLFSGLLITVELTVISIALGAILAALLTWARLSGPKVVRAAAYAYSYAVRGTPLLAQVFLVYYGSGQFRPELQALGLWPLFREPQFCVLLTFSLNTAAYQSEIFRGAVLAVPRGQMEAAKALALKPWLAMLMIVAPQAARHGLRGFGNEVVLVLKGSAVASVVTVYDLLGATRFAFQRTYDFQLYVAAAVVYIVIVEILRRSWNHLEARFRLKGAR
ncbi:ABC transporter permease [Rhizobium sp. RAF36]|uniref:ABC transporter permease n=1 Tax=Rhizobium sp. RAF36 TaxID=3233055 RepID=UPI003F960592